MFVRFRKQSNSGFRPVAARNRSGDEVKWQWVGKYEHVSPGWIRRRRRHRKWSIACGGDQYLEPYRIKVALVENARIDGKVKQEVIVTLGAIDATWLESFWATAPQPELRVENWDLYSLRHRSAFWQGVLERMARIGDNRLSKNDRVAIRRAIHQVVPWVMEPERKRLALLEAQHDYSQVKLFHDWADHGVRDDQHTIKRATESLKKHEAERAEFAEHMLHAGLRIAKLQ
jgi:hypothetical protein